MKELVMLGTGNAMVTHCYNTCFFVRLENGEIFLTDAGGGNGILRQMELAGADWKRVHHMFVTHGHTDHVLGVIWVIRKIATLMNQGKFEGELHIYCHDAVKEMLETMARMTLKKKDLAQLGSRIILQEMKDGEKVPFEGLVLTAFDILSTKAKQFGYQLEFSDGMRFTCLGDEPYNEHAKQYAEGADWLLSEAFCLYGARDVFKPYEKNHSTVKEASELATELGVKNLVLYHTEDKDMAHRKANYTEEARRYYQGNVLVPDDLERISLAS
ncbi:MAG: MBL fold metallo-hydrolase [Selenomonadaceae bacterium]|nr:MBL fold metallo-hydrolase [Selenomonadaceae bacterium]